MAHKKIEDVSAAFWESEVNETNREIIESFLEQGHLSDRTLRQYESALKIFAKWVYDTTYSKRKGSEKEFHELKPLDALKYQTWLINLGLSNNSIKFKRSAVSSLCGFIELYYADEYPLFRNIYTKSIPNVEKSNVKEKQPLSTKEIETLARALEKQGEWQKLAYLWLTYATGCRREEARQFESEMVHLPKPVDKDGKERKYYITNVVRAKGKGKKGKPRRFKYDERAMTAVRKWLAVRAEITAEAKEKNPAFVDDCPLLFVSKGKDGFRGMHENTFNTWCDKFSDTLGGRPVHPHLFRSSRATNAVVEEGKDIKSVQKMLGHNSSETTEIYIVRNDADDDDDLYG